MAADAQSQGLSHDNRALPGLPIFVFLMAFLACIVVGLRLYVRVWLKSVAGSDDLLICPALAFALAWSGGLMSQIYQGGYGRHQVYLTLDNVRWAWIWNLAENVLAAGSVFWARASIIALLLRLVSKIKYWKYFLWFALLLNTIIFVGTSVTYGVLCVPIQKNWNPDIPGHCVVEKTFDQTLQAFGALNAVVDFMCALTPFLVVHSLQMAPRVKLSLYGVLCCGVVTAACGIGRIVALNFSVEDKTYDLIPLTYWTAAETYGAIILASLPAMYQLGNYLEKERSLRKVNPNAARPYRPDPALVKKANDSRQHFIPPNAIGRTTDMYIELADAPSESSGNKKFVEQRYWNVV